MVKTRHARSVGSGITAAGARHFDQVYGPGVDSVASRVMINASNQGTPSHTNIDTRVCGIYAMIVVAQGHGKLLQGTLHKARFEHRTCSAPNVRQVIQQPTDGLAHASKGFMG